MGVLMDQEFDTILEDGSTMKVILFMCLTICIIVRAID